MEMDVFTIFLKYLLLATSMLMSTSNIILISFGVTATGSAGYKNFAYVTAGVGMYLICTGIVGTFAGIRESHILSVWYMATAGIGFVITLVFLIFFACMRDDLFDATKDRVEKAWSVHAEEPDLMNKIQDYYHCCGREGPEDYIKDDDDIFPSSCCLNFDCTHDINKFKDGCYDDVVETFETRSEILIYSLVATLLLIAASIAITYFFARKLAQQRKSDLAEIALKQDEGK